MAANYSARVKSLNLRLGILAFQLTYLHNEPILQCTSCLLELLEAPRQAFARLCPELCPACAEACCRRVSYRGVMDETDLVFLAAQGITELPPSLRHDGLCPWLGDEGCALPWNARPFACLHYLCAPLRDAMNPDQLKKIRAALAQAGDARSGLLKLFMEP